MPTIAHFDRVITDLQGMTATHGRQPTSGAAFKGVFATAIGSAEALLAPAASASATEAQPTSDGNNSFRLVNLLVDDVAIPRLARPNMREFMDATGISSTDASELLYGVIGSNTDLRDWRAIMASDNPVDAARAATRQLYNSDLDYQLGQRPEKGTDAFDEILAERSITPEETIVLAGNFAVVIEPKEDQEPEDAVPFVSAVTSTGLKLREAGGTREQIERTAWLFGFDLSQVASMAAQTRVRSEHLADVLESLGSSS